MKALTVWNPWAAAILVGGKDVENRVWKLPERYEGERVLIHAGKRYAKEAVGPGGALKGPGWIHGLPLSGERGVLLGSVVLERATEAEECQLEWCQRVPGGWAWLLKDPRVFEKPVAWSGALGLFDVPEEDPEVAAALAGAVEPAVWLEKRRRQAMEAAMEREANLGTLD